MSPNISSSISQSISDLAVSTPIVQNPTITLANTEYNHTLPAGTKRFKIQNRDSGLVKLSYTSGQSGSVYWSIFPGQQYDGENVSNGATINLYYQSPKSSQTLEIVSWS